MVIEIKREDFIISGISSLGIGHGKIRADDAFINCINDNGIRWIDIYATLKTRKVSKHE